MKTENSARKAPWQLAAILLLAAIGLGLGVLLSQEYYDVRNGTAGFHSICNINSTFNCSAVASSSWAQFVGGIPLSSFAVGWFLATIVVAVMAYLQDWRQYATRALFGLASGGIGFSIFYAIVMFAIVKTLCLYCLLLDVVNVLLFVTVLSMKPGALISGLFADARWKTVAGLVIGSLVISVILMKTFDQVSIDPSMKQAMVEHIMNSAPVSVNAGAEFPSIGPKDAPITLVEFSDFQCPFCRMGAFSLNAVLNANPGKVRVVFRNYPLDMACNPKVQHRMHPFSCEAAKVGICARKQDKFEPVYQELFERQADFNHASPTEIASGVPGMDAAALKACIGSPETAALVAQDIDEGNRLNIDSTPTFFINGRRMDGMVPPAEVWNQVIDRLLAPPAK